MRQTRERERCTLALCCYQSMRLSCCAKCRIQWPWERENEREQTPAEPSAAGAGAFIARVTHRLGATRRTTLNPIFGRREFCFSSLSGCLLLLCLTSSNSAAIRFRLTRVRSVSVSSVAAAVAVVVVVVAVASRI